MNESLSELNNENDAKSESFNKKETSIKESPLKFLHPYFTNNNNKTPVKSQSLFAKYKYQIFLVLLMMGIDLISTAEDSTFHVTCHSFQTKKILKNILSRKKMQRKLQIDGYLLKINDKSFIFECKCDENGL